MIHQVDRLREMKSLHQTRSTYSAARLSMPYIAKQLFLGILVIVSTSTMNLYSSENPSLDKTWGELKAALKASQAEEVADFVSFPLESNLAEITGYEKITSRKGFIELFEEIFPADARAFLTQLSSEDAFHFTTQVQVEGTSGTRYRTTWNSVGQDPDSEYSIVYSFEKQESGGFKIVAIDFAG